MRTSLLLMLLSLCTACGQGGGGDGVGGVSASEARALNEAAEMLDRRIAPQPAPDATTASASGENAAEGNATAGEEP